MNNGPLKVLLAPSAYKGSFSPAQVADAMKRGALSAIPDARVLLCPIADGGDGTVESIHLAAGGKIETLEVEGALGKPQIASWLNLGNTAVVELASACGIAALGNDLRPLAAHTRGLGQVIRHCLGLKVFSSIIIALGGSASTDGAAGALTALGFHFLDEAGKELPQGGGGLIKLDRVVLPDVKELVGKTLIRVAVDVNNPLLGEHGAARIFAPQKGATPSDVEHLEKALEHYARVLEHTTGRHEAGESGAGAAGGAAFGLASGLGAKIRSGFQMIAGLTVLEKKIASSDLVITGEGSLDAQSLSGKASGELIGMCRKHERPLIAVPAIAEGDMRAAGFALVKQAAENGKASLDDISHATGMALIEHVLRR